MCEYVFKATNLGKRFGKVTVLNNININIPNGCIYGLIGENGAGKTTLFRIIVGLSERSTGDLMLFGKSDKSELIQMRKEIGCTIEAPAICASMSVFDNMKIQSIARGIADKNRIDEILSLINLSEQKNKKVLNLSYGMKQRLALGLALLHNPKFLVLDEPTNGLDPVGIMEFRELLKKLNKEKGITILIASHILSELEHFATHYGIIHKGKIIEEISSQKLIDKCRKYIKILVNNVPKSTQILRENLKVEKFDVIDNYILLYDYINSTADVSTVLSQNGIRVSEFSLVSEDLETYFSKVILRGDNNNAKFS